MTGRTVLAAFIIASFGATASAQDKKVEISATAGYTFADGVSGAATDPFGNEYSRIDPADGFSWNVRIGYQVSETSEVGAFFGSLSSNLGITLNANRANVAEFPLGDEKIYNYYGYYAYHFGEAEKVKPYILIGLGATQFGGVSVKALNVPVPHDNRQEGRTIGGSTKFSTLFAAGVKVLATKSVLIRFEGRWTPTYLKRD